MTFGDWTDDDALDVEAADPEQVARRLHALRRREGFEAIEWDHLAPAERGALVQIVVALLAWLRRQGSG